MDILFNDPFKVIEDGAVKIQFERSNGKIRVAYVIDFAKTKLNPSEAATLQKAIVAVLRAGLGVDLSECK